MGGGGGRGGGDELHTPLGAGRAGVAMGAGTDLGMHWAGLNTIIMR